MMRWRYAGVMPMLRRCYADATPAFVRTYDAFAALKLALV